MPKIVTYVDGPFFADPSLNRKENQSALRNAVYEKMSERSKMNNIELIKYIKKSDEE